MTKDQELVIKAIKHYDCYSDGQKNVLSLLYQLSVNNTTVIKVAKIAEITGYSRYTIYKCLKQFEQDNILTMSGGGQKLPNTFNFNESKLQLIIDTYKKFSHIIKTKYI